MLAPRYVHMHLIGLLGLTACAPSPLPAVTPLTSAPAPAVAPSPPALAAQEGDAHFEGIRFRDGQTLADVRLHYATAGTPHRGPDGAIDNAVLMLHWTSASGEALRTRAFADSLFAAGKPLDLARNYVVFLDAIGHGRSSKPSDGLHARFPAYGYEDMVQLQHRVVTETLGLTHLRAIVGLSMGGMNAWQWSVRHPGFMDAIVPIVALPAPIRGRNLIWRRIVARQIRTDPEWLGGDYASPPRGWLEAFPFFRMMLDGVPHLDATVGDVNAAGAFIQDASSLARRMDANDVLYALESSSDYDPTPGLGAIRAQVFALNFGDDEFNPVALGVLESSMKRVPRGRFVNQPGTPASFGHFTQAHPELWASHIHDFMAALDADAR